MNHKYPLIYFFVALLTLSLTTSCEKDDDNDFTIGINDDNVGDDIIEPGQNGNDTPKPAPLSDANLKWLSTRNVVENTMPTIYNRVYKDDNTTVYECNSTPYNVTISYSFDGQDRLLASCVTADLGAETDAWIKSALKGYNKIQNDDDDEMTLYINGTNMLGMTELTAGTSKYYSLSYGPYIEEGSATESDEWVDLGLSVLWAKCNVGASSPEGTGKYFAWGETKTKSRYWRETYEWATQDGYIFNYHNPLKEISGTEYDAATQLLGNGWRMPTLKEASELISKCTFKEETLNNVTGCRVTGPNGNSIFIPYVGIARQDEIRDFTQWYSTGSSSGTTSESCSIINIRSHELDTQWKAWGYNIRPVLDK